MFILHSPRVFSEKKKYIYKYKKKETLWVSGKYIKKNWRAAGLEPMMSAPSHSISFFFYIYIYIFFLIKKEENDDWRKEKMTTATQPGIEPGTSRFLGNCSTS